MKVIFLDIDGVLQPGWAQNRFKHDLSALKQEHILLNPVFQIIDQYDLGAVVYDWAPNSVRLLTKLLENTDAKIVVSSSWRTYRTLQYLQLLFSIYHLHPYIIDKTPEFTYGPRGAEIAAYLIEHPEIKNFVIIDDDAYSLADRFPQNFVHCRYQFEEENFILALQTLTRPTTPIVAAPMASLY